MFEIDDIIRIKKGHYYPNDYDFNQLHQIIRTYKGGRLSLETIFVIKGLTDDVERHYSEKALDKDITYERKKKLNKICSRLET